MAERYTHGDSVERDHRAEPQTPPSHVVEPDLKDAPASPVGVAGMWYVLGPLMLIVVVVAAGAYFWMDDDGRADPDETSIGTFGEPGNEATPGGFNPDPDQDSTGNEVEYRGGGEPRQGPMPGLGTTAGESISLQDVEVLDVSGSTFWVQHGGHKMAVVADDAPAVRKGARVDIRGTMERDGQGMRVRASEVNIR